MTTKDTGGPAFPSERDMRHNPDFDHEGGMTLHDYAAIKFAAAWVAVLGNTEMTETRDQRTAEANRLGRLQADEFIKARTAS